MEVSLSDTGGLSRRLEVAVPATEVANEVQQRLKRLSRTARLKGFRPGKAPLAASTKPFGGAPRDPGDPARGPRHRAPGSRGVRDGRGRHDREHAPAAAGVHAGRT